MRIRSIVGLVPIDRRGGIPRRLFGMISGGQLRQVALNLGGGLRETRVLHVRLCGSFVTLLRRLTHDTQAVIMGLTDRDYTVSERHVGRIEIQQLWL